jgi:glyoxylase-like metal-dependent hydrolase (beta-lactamase superfamily II)
MIPVRWETIHGKTGAIITDMALIPTYLISENEVILVDTGARKDPALCQELDRQNLRVAAVLYTHLHVDHIANGREIAARYGAKFYANELEIQDMKGRYARMNREKALPRVLDAEPDYSIVPLEDSADRVIVMGAQFGILPTPGHTRGHLAFITPDGVCCLGDAMMAGVPLERAKLPFMEDVDLSMLSMERIRQTHYSYYAASHSGWVSYEDMPALVDENIKKEVDLYELVRSQITAPMEVEKAVTIFMQAARISPQTVMGSKGSRMTAKGRLDSLVHAGEFRIENDMIIPCKG